MTEFVRERKPAAGFLTDALAQHNIATRHILNSQNSTFIALYVPKVQFKADLRQNSVKAPAAVLPEALQEGLCCCGNWIKFLGHASS